MFNLSAIDWLIFSFIQVITLSIAFYFRKQKDNSLIEYLLMGRRLTLPLFVATLVSTWYGGIMGVAQIAYNSGIYNFITQGFFWYLAYIIFALFMVDKIRKDNPLSLPDLVEKNFGMKARYIASLFNFANVLPIAYITSLGLLLKMFFDFSFLESMLIGGGFVFLYSLFGGLKAIVLTDVIQFFVMCSSVLIVFLFCFFSYGITPLKSLPISMYSLDGGHGFLTTLSWGLIAFSTLVDPNFYQRCFAATSTKVAKKGILISTGIWLIFDLSLTFGAMYARAFYPGHPQDGYLRFSLEILPLGLKGYFLAGIFSIILSTLDSYLFIAGTTLTYDLKIIKNLKNWHHHLSTLFVTLFAIIFSLFFEGNIKNIWKTFGSYSASCLLIPISLKLLFKMNISEKAFLLSIFLSVIAVTYWRLSSHVGIFQNIDEIYIGCFVSLISLILFNFKKFKGPKTTTF